MRWLMFAALLGFAGLVPGPGLAGEVRHLEIGRRDGAYWVRFEAVVGLAPDRLFALLTDYDRLERLHPGIVAAERLSGQGGGQRVRTVVEACVAIFCRQLERVEAVRHSDKRLIRADLVPEGSDFRAGNSRWELAAVGQGTRLRFRSRMVPDFWVPPVVGPWAIEQELGNHLRGLVRRLERLAAGGSED